MSTVLDELRERERGSIYDLEAVAKKCRDIEFGVSGGYGVRSHVLASHQRSTFDLDFVVRRKYAEVLISELRGLDYKRVRGRTRKAGFSLGFRKETMHGAIKADVSVDDVYDRYRTKIRYPLTSQVMEDVVYKEVRGILAPDAKALIPVLCAEDLLILKALPSRPADQVDICSLLADVKIDFGRLGKRLRDVRIAENFCSGMRLLDEAIRSGRMEREVSQKIGQLEPTSWKRMRVQLEKCLRAGA